MQAKPNILIIMVDQLNGTLFPDGGPAAFLHAPNLKRLARRSARFANCYTSSPLCAPARASFMSGQLPRRTRVYDNAAEFASDIPTYAHHLRRAGYRTCLSGKMHFVGPDQLHGFEERLTTDIYPADFGWTPDYRKPGERIDWWYHNMGSVTGAGVAEITNQLEYDENVAHEARMKIYDLGREGEDANRRPWCLTVSFTHPHDPYVARKKYWDLYEDCAHLLPEVPAFDHAEHDPHSRRIFDSCDWHNFTITEENIRRSRRAYFANISWLDEKIGELMGGLEATRQAGDTIILFCSDHGDMLGERGLWFKMNFFEGSARVPLMIAAPQLKPGKVATPVSNVDILPTLMELAGISMDEILPWTDGESLVKLAPAGGKANRRDTPVAIEYAAEASWAPMVCLRQGRYKFVHCELDPPLLFDLAADPHELVNLAAGIGADGKPLPFVSGDPHLPQAAPAAATPGRFPLPDETRKRNCVASPEAVLAADNFMPFERRQALVRRFMKAVRARWDMAGFDAEVRQSQARRWVVYEALRNGAYFPWDFQPLKNAAEAYMRNHMNLDTLEGEKRWPRGE